MTTRALCSGYVPVRLQRSPCLPPNPIFKSAFHAISGGHARRSIAQAVFIPGAVFSSCETESTAIPDVLLHHPIRDVLGRQDRRFVDARLEGCEGSRTIPS